MALATLRHSLIVER